MSSTMRRSFQLQGRDEGDLARRIDTFRDAVRARRGTILRIDWRVGTFYASVLYRVPVEPGVQSEAL